MSTIVLHIPVADPTRSRPLSSSEIVGSSKPLPSLPPQPNYEPSGSRPSTSRASLEVPPSVMTPGSLGSVLQEPRILARFLRYVRWHDFQSLALTCRTCSNVLHHPKLRDAVLSRFVPGYRYCLQHADADTISSIDVEFSDLSHFMVSQRLPLHHYPTLALTTLSSSDTAALKEKIQRLVMLCQAHSRVILLLQALIHSASSLLRGELDDPSLRYRNSAQQGGRELVFPAPLSFTPNDGDSKANDATSPRGHFRFFSMPSAAGRACRSLKADPPKRSPSVMSMLRRNTVPPPPPEADPLGLKIYAVSWRGRKRMSTVTGQTSEYDKKVPRRPKINIVSTPDSSGSSTVNTPSPRSTRQAEISPITVTMPHDIRAATSRLRAPILRVFFPCSKVNRRAITACEAQLDDAGLWQHLSVGDIICNLGYLPPSDGVGPSGNEVSFDNSSSPESWMIFDGTVLVPYTASAILPISEPLWLPSPFYYAHITPPPINPRFIATLPREEQEPELSLVLLPTKVPSPHSPNGFARIRKYQWLAHVRPHVRPGLGEGWHGEWVLEGEGTKEGRQSLLDALSGYVNVKREWELIMERSTPTRIWLRLISISGFL
ncbi:hypothetical protein F5888DRAFT_1250675 [Russula emetica]|nr:hypothetical protein F5888DRAFT_1250675 [Russula emetica]